MTQHYTQINNGVKKVWNVERIWTLAENLPVIELSIDEIRGLDEVTWFSPDLQPTVRSIVEHSKRILECDLSYPVILTENNCVFDGMHRLARHLYDGKKTIKVKKFQSNPEPDETEILNPHIA